MSTLPVDEGLLVDESWLPSAFRASPYLCGTPFELPGSSAFIPTECIPWTILPDDRTSSYQQTQTKMRTMEIISALTYSSNTFPIGTSPLLYLSLQEYRLFANPCLRFTSFSLKSGGCKSSDPDQRGGNAFPSVVRASE